MTIERIPAEYVHFIESYPTTWEKQKSLNELGFSLSPRSNEVFFPNEYYGLDLIVKAFLELGQERSLKFGVPHGVELGDDRVGNVYGLGTVLSTLTYNNPIGLKNLITNRVPGWKIPAEHPILLLRNLMEDLQLLHHNPIKNATLFFPAHLQEGVNFEDKLYDKYICSKLSLLRTVKHDIEISLPGVDIQLNRHLVYEAAGFNVVSSGHIFDPYFLSRFTNLVTSYKEVATAEAGSHLFYTAALGCRTIFWDLGLPMVQLLAGERRNDSPFEIDSAAKTLFRDKQEINRATAENYLGGTGKSISKSYWRDIHRASIIRDYWAIFEPIGEGFKLAIPRLLRRQLVSTLNFLNIS